MFATKRIQHHDGEDCETEHGTAPWSPAGGNRHRERGGDHHRQHPGRIDARLGVRLGGERDRDHDCMVWSAIVAFPLLALGL
jgi:hypothetical protein